MPPLAHLVTRLRALVGISLADCAAHGTFSGEHVGTWLGVQASGVRLSVDFGMHWRVVDGLIIEGWAIFDLPKAFLPLGVDLLLKAQQDQPNVAEPPADSEEGEPMSVGSETVAASSAATEMATGVATTAGAGVVRPADNQCSVA